MNSINLYNNLYKYGFYFTPPGLIYSEDLAESLTELLAQLSAGWVVLESPRLRAIPEQFIRTIAGRGLKIVIDLNLSPAEIFRPEEFEPLIKAYSHWGAEFILSTKYPNHIQATGSDFWVKNDPVSFAAENFTKLAQICAQTAIIPLLPLLNPLGNYPDTAFFETFLSQLVEKGEKSIVDKLMLAAPAFTYNRDLNWGAGGKFVHPKFFNAADYEEANDHVGFHCCEWYQEISKKILGKTVPCILFEAGKISPGLDDVEAERILEIARLVIGENVEFPQSNKTKEIFYESVSTDVIGCLLGINLQSLYYGPPKDQQSTEAVFRIFMDWLSRNDELSVITPMVSDADKSDPSFLSFSKRVILLPEEEVRRDHFWKKALEEYLIRYPSKIVYSSAEARRAVHVLALGDEDQFTEESIQELQSFGAHVRHIHPKHFFKTDRVSYVR